MRTGGAPVTDRYGKEWFQIGSRIPVDVHKLVVEKALTERRTVSTVISMIIEEYFNNS